MSIALVSHSAASLGATGGTTSAIDTTGASLLVVAAGYYSGSAAPTLTDSKSNTWTDLVQATHTSSGTTVQMFFASSPTVGASHTFTLSGAAEYSSIAIAAFSGSLAGGSADLNLGASGVQPGSGTPSHDNELVVAAAGFGSGGTVPAPSGFTLTDQVGQVGGSAYGVAFAYLVQTAATAENPTWSGVTAIASVMASFQVAGAAPNRGSFFPFLRGG